jgi:hypothetical protein
MVLLLLTIVTLSSPDAGQPFSDYKSAQVLIHLATHFQIAVTHGTKGRGSPQHGVGGSGEKIRLGKAPRGVGSKAVVVLIPPQGN